MSLSHSHTVDGRNPAPPGMYKNPANYGINGWDQWAINPIYK